MRSTSVVPGVVSQLEDIFRMHHPTRNNYCILHNEKYLERKSSADRITCFLPLYYNPLFILELGSVLTWPWVHMKTGSCDTEYS